MKLRDYQEEAIAAVIAARKRGVRRQLVCLPTGAGKTVVFAALAARARQPVLVLAHRAELLQQARDKLAAVLGGERAVTLEQAQHRATDSAECVVASLRSLQERRLERLLRGWNFGLVIYDECHHAPAADNERVLRELGCFDPQWEGTLLGVTATTQRGDGEGLEKIFEEIVYHRDIGFMIDRGWLVPMKGFRIETGQGLAADEEAEGDFGAAEVAASVDVEERNALVARALQELARDRRSLVFCASVKHAQGLAEVLQSLGVAATAVWGALASEEREARLRGFREERFQVLTNVAVLTEGFDDPGVSCVAMARPTRSTTLYAQCVGRGLRLHPGKEDCLVLDFVDLSSVPLVTLPTLFGLPRDLDLEGGDVREAARILGPHQGAIEELEVHPGAITLEEIQRRAAAFDPLRLRVHPEVRAISPHAWQSLGRWGIALWYEPRPGVAALYEVLRGRAPGARWRVYLDGKEIAGFDDVMSAVEATDYEIRRLGPKAAASAAPEAVWRSAPIDPPLRDRLFQHVPPYPLHTRGEALAWLGWAGRERQRQARPSKR